MFSRYEEWDVNATTRERIKGAFKYTSCLVALVVILLLIGLFIPVAQDTKGHLDLDYFKKLLLENRMHLPTSPQRKAHLADSLNLDRW